MARERTPRAGFEGLSAVLFVAFVVIGVAFIVIAKSLSIPAPLVTGVPVLVMLLYGGAVMAVRALRLRDDQAGDNLYYMGFLFTLTSLGVSLYQFSAQGGAEQIVQNFGIAIGSTIAGVALRVLFNQMRRDPVEVERTARLELAEASRRVRRELDNSVVELAHFRRATQQSITEGVGELGGLVKATSEKIMQGVEDVMSRAAQPLETASNSSAAALGSLTSAMADTLETAARRLAAENDRLSVGTELLSAALERVAGNLEAMSTPERVIEINLQAMGRDLSNSLEALGAQIERSSEINRQVLAALQDSQKRNDVQAAAVDAIAAALTSPGAPLPAEGRATGRAGDPNAEQLNFDLLTRAVASERPSRFQENTEVVS